MPSSDKNYVELLKIHPEIQKQSKTPEIGDRMPYRPLNLNNNVALKEMITRLAEPTCNLIGKDHIKSLYYFCGGECSNLENTKEKIFLEWKCCKSEILLFTALCNWRETNADWKLENDCCKIFDI